MKKMLALILSAVMLLCLPLAGAMADEVTEVNFWSIYTGDDFRIIQGVVDAFNEANPDVHINHVAISADEMYTKMALVAGDDSAAPVAVIMHSYNIPSFAKQQILDPLDDFLTGYGDFSEDLYLSNDAGKVDGVRYGYVRARQSWPIGDLVSWFAADERTGATLYRLREDIVEE